MSHESSATRPALASVPRVRLLQPSRARKARRYYIVGQVLNFGSLQERESCRDVAARDEHALEALPRRHPGDLKTWSH